MLLEKTFYYQQMVKDSECDMEGIVNHARYLHYLEHARHLFLEEQGVSFASLVKQNINLVVSELNIKYQSPLRSHDNFVVSVSMSQQSRLKFRFDQTISTYSANHDKTIVNANAQIIGIAMDEQGKPIKANINQLLSIEV